MVYLRNTGVFEFQNILVSASQSTYQHQLACNWKIYLQALSGADLGGSRGPVPPSKLFYLYVTATINSMKISFNDVLSFINVKNYVYSYIIYRCW